MPPHDLLTSPALNRLNWGCSVPKSGWTELDCFASRPEFHTN